MIVNRFCSWDSRQTRVKERVLGTDKRLKRNFLFYLIKEGLPQKQRMLQWNMPYHTCHCGKDHDLPPDFVDRAFRCEACGSVMKVKKKPRYSKRTVQSTYFILLVGSSGTFQIILGLILRSERGKRIPFWDQTSTILLFLYIGGSLLCLFIYWILSLRKMALERRHLNSIATHFGGTNFDGKKLPYSKHKVQSIHALLPLIPAFLFMFIMLKVKLSSPILPFLAMGTVLTCLFIYWILSLRRKALERRHLNSIATNFGGTNFDDNKLPYSKLPYSSMATHFGGTCVDGNFRGRPFVCESRIARFDSSHPEEHRGGLGLRIRRYSPVEFCVVKTVMMPSSFSAVIAAVHSPFRVGLPEFDLHYVVTARYPLSLLTYSDKNNFIQGTDLPNIFDLPDKTKNYIKKLFREQNAITKLSQAMEAYQALFQDACHLLEITPVLCCENYDSLIASQAVCEPTQLSQIHLTNLLSAMDEFFAVMPQET